MLLFRRFSALAWSWHVAYSTGSAWNPQSGSSVLSHQWVLKVYGESQRGGPQHRSDQGEAEEVLTRRTSQTTTRTSTTTACAKSKIKGLLFVVGAKSQPMYDLARATDASQFLSTSSLCPSYPVRVGLPPSLAILLKLVSQTTLQLSAARYSG